MVMKSWIPVAAQQGNKGARMLVDANGSPPLRPLQPMQSGIKPQGVAAPAEWHDPSWSISRDWGCLP